MAASLVDYDNRKVDIMITSGYEGELEMVFPNKIITGIQKGVQRFIFLMFTAIKSHIFDRGTGSFFAKNVTEIIGQVEAGNAANLLSLSMSEVMDQLLLQKSQFSDENIIAARLENYSIEKDKLKADVALDFESGDTYKFILPLDIPLTTA